MTFDVNVLHTYSYVDPNDHYIQPVYLKAFDMLYSKSKKKKLKCRSKRKEIELLIYTTFKEHFKYPSVLQ